MKTVAKTSKSSTMDLPNIKIHKSLGAAGKNYPVKIPSGGHVKLAENTEITKIKVLAGKGTNKSIRNAIFLENDYKIDSGEWQKVRGEGYIIENGKKLKVELHWYEAENERVEMKVKRYYDEG